MHYTPVGKDQRVQQFAHKCIHSLRVCYTQSVLQETTGESTGSAKSKSASPKNCQRTALPFIDPDLFKLLDQYLTSKLRAPLYISWGKKEKINVCRS